MAGLIGQAQASENTLQKDRDLALQVVRTTMYDDETFDNIVKLVTTAGDPIKAMGKAVVGALLPVAQALHEKHPQLDDAIWLCDGGALDGILDEMVEIAQEAGVQIEDPEEAKEIVKATVIDDVQKLADAEGGAQQPEPEQMPQPEAAPAPQQAPSLIGRA